MKKKLLVCTFSGGRTSAFMVLLLKEHPKYKDFDKVYIFANTGKERSETLEFINKCDKEWGLSIVWIEANVKAEKGVGTRKVWAGPKAQGPHQHERLFRLRPPLCPKAQHEKRITNNHNGPDQKTVLF